MGSALNSQDSEKAITLSKLPCMQQRFKKSPDSQLLMLRQCEEEDSESYDEFDRKEVRKQADEKFNFINRSVISQSSQIKPDDSRLIQEQKSSERNNS